MKIIYQSNRRKKEKLSFHFNLLTLLNTSKKLACKKKGLPRTLSFISSSGEVKAAAQKWLRILNHTALMDLGLL